MELVSVRLSPDGDGLKVTDRDSDCHSVTSFRLSDFSNVRVICQGSYSSAAGLPGPEY